MTDHEKKMDFNLRTGKADPGSTTTDGHLGNKTSGSRSSATESSGPVK